MQEESLYEYFFFMLEYGEGSKWSDNLVDVTIDPSFCAKEKKKKK